MKPKTIWTRRKFLRWSAGDTNGDGLLDIVTSNKKPVNVFLQAEAGRAN